MSHHPCHVLLACMVTASTWQCTPHIQPHPAPSKPSSTPAAPDIAPPAENPTPTVTTPSAPDHPADKACSSLPCQEALAVLRDNAIQTKVPVEYDLTKDILVLETSVPVLDAVAQLLLRYPDIHLEIRVHSELETESYGRKPTQKRADAVRKYLISQGVEAHRLTAKGYGGTQPIAPDTPEERFKNRRTEFIVVEGTANGPHPLNPSP